MISFSNILAAIVASWQDVPAVVTAMNGDPEAIYSTITSRPGEPQYRDILEKSPWPSILVSHVTTGLGFRGGFNQWRHTFRADIKVMGDVVDYPTLIVSLVDGIPTGGGGLTLMQCSFIEGVDSMEDVVFSREQDANGKEFY